MLSQKEAVFNAVQQVCDEHGKSFDEGQKYELTKDERAQVVEIVMAGFENNEVELKSDQENLKSYTGGLVSNWLRKDKRLNGGTTYKPANPGSRTGQSDDQVKNMRILLGTLPEGSDEANKVQQAIDSRIAEIKAEKAKSKAKEIDPNSIPAELQHLISN